LGVGYDLKGASTTFYPIAGQKFSPVRAQRALPIIISLPGLVTLDGADYDHTRSWAQMQVLY